MEYKYNVLKRVRQLEEKNGIKYAKTDGRLYGTIKLLYTIVFVYTLVINFLFILSNSIVYYGDENFNTVKGPLVTVTTATFLLILAFIIMRFKNKVWANFASGITNVLAAVLLVLTFANLMKDSLGLFGYVYSFYWRHAIPLLLLVVFAVWLTVIALRANIKTDKQYKKVMENIYAQYNLSAENGQLSEEQWEEFLENYNC